MEKKITLLISEYKKTKDERYFNEILERFKPLLNSYASKLFYLEHDDSFQELSLALFEAISNMQIFDNEYACIAYIQKVIMHKFTKLYRKSKQAQQINYSNVPLDTACNLDGLRSYTDDSILEIDLQNLLKSKSHVEKNILYLIMMWYSDKEIGIILGYSRQYINRIKKRLLK